GDGTGQPAAARARHPDVQRDRPTLTKGAAMPPVGGSAAPWRDRLEALRTAFPSPWRDAADDRHFEHTLLQTVHLIDRMKHPRMYAGQKAWQGYLGDPAL